MSHDVSASTHSRTYYRGIQHMHIYRKIWTEHNGPIPKEPNGRSYEIHHKDGNHINNDINNLQCVTIQNHFDIHYQQQDWGACNLLAQKMKKSPALISEMASLANKKRLQEGNHPFLNVERTKKSVQDRVINGTHNFLGGELQRQRAKNGTHPFLGGQIQRITAIRIHKKRLDEGIHHSQQEHKCPCCGKIGKSVVMFRYHFSKCKFLSLLLS